jgi:hypothetical protein
MNEEQIRARFEDLLLPLMDDAYNLARWLLKNPTRKSLKSAASHLVRSCPAWHVVGTSFT